MFVLHYGDFALPNPGCIDPSRPDAANHVIVGDLGEDEVLLVACDNGNVIGYRTELISDVFENPGESAISEHAKLDVKPFFVQDVGASACK